VLTEFQLRTAIYTRKTQNSFTSRFCSPPNRKYNSCVVAKSGPKRKW